MNVNEAETSLARVADRGYIVFKMAGGMPHLVNSNKDISVAEIAASDPLARWMEPALGVSDLREIAKASGFIRDLQIGGHAIGLAGLSGGQKVITLMFRSNDDLTEEMTAEAFAASFVIAGPADAFPKVEATPKVAAYITKVVDGHDDQEIAEELDLSLRAVKERKKKAIDEYHAKTLSHAVALSVRSSG